MVHYTWKKLDSFPLALAVVFAVGIFVPCMIALYYRHVSPYVPYISEGGGQFPEAGIFSTCICITAFLSQWIIMLRFIIVQEMNSLVENDKNIFFNKISLALGFLSSVALIVLASYPASTISQVHNSAAGVACVCYVIYMVCHTVISFRILGNTKISMCRLLLTILSTSAVVLVTTFGLIGSSEWTAEYWAGKKTPEDKGFEFYLISSTSEWVMACLLILYYSTFISEFKKSTLHFYVDIFGRAKDKKRQSRDDLYYQ